MTCYYIKYRCTILIHPTDETYMIDTEGITQVFSNTSFGRKRAIIQNLIYLSLNGTHGVRSTSWNGSIITNETHERDTIDCSNRILIYIIVSTVVSSLEPHIQSIVVRIFFIITFRNYHWKFRWIKYCAVVCGCIDSVRHLEGYRFRHIHMNQHSSMCTLRRRYASQGGQNLPGRKIIVLEELFQCCQNRNCG